jgi:hypothetical protein
LKPSGLHSDENTPALDNPSDPPTTASAETATSTTASSTAETTSTASESASPSPSPTAAANPEEDADDADSDEPNGWWHSIWGKVEELKDWASDLFESVKEDISSRGRG